MRLLNLRPKPNGDIPVISPRVHRHDGGAASAIFCDATGVECVFAESRLNNPVLVLGTHLHAMVLHLRHIRDLHRLMGRFLATGSLTTDHTHDYQI